MAASKAWLKTPTPGSLAPRLLFFLALLLPGLAKPCDCGNWPLDSTVAHANVVFVGTCLNISPNPIKGDYNIVFQVDSSWKRGIEHMATIHTPNTSCNAQFEKGKRYLVYAMKKRQTIHTGACDHLTEFDGTLPPQVKALGGAFLPGRPAFARSMVVLMLGLGLGGLALVAFVVLRKRIFKRKS